MKRIFLVVLVVLLGANVAFAQLFTIPAGRSREDAVRRIGKQYKDQITIVMETELEGATVVDTSTDHWSGLLEAVLKPDYGYRNEGNGKIVIFKLNRNVRPPSKPGTPRLYVNRDDEVAARPQARPAVSQANIKYVGAEFDILSPDYKGEIKVQGFTPAYPNTFQGRIARPTLPEGHPYRNLLPDRRCGAIWFDAPYSGTGVTDPGWYRWQDYFYRPLQYGDCGEYQQYHNPYNYQMAGGGAHGAGVYGGAYGGYGSQYSYSLNYGSYGGWYGMPLFGFQIEELRQKYQDRRNMAKVKFDGGNCGNKCLSNVQVLVVIDDEPYYLTGTKLANNWYEKPIWVPLDRGKHNSASLLFVREEAGTMKGFKRNIILPPAALQDKATEVQIDPGMFEQAMEISIRQQHVEVEVSPGKFETRSKPVISYK